MIRIFFIVFVTLAALMPQRLFAQDRSEAAANEIFNEVMSPFCPGRLLNDCPSSSAAELRDKIRGELQSGHPKSQVLEEIYSTFGADLRAAPENKGFGMVAWWAPVVFLFGGGLLGVYWLRRTRNIESSPDGAAANALPTSMESRINAELERFEG